MTEGPTGRGAKALAVLMAVGFGARWLAGRDGTAVEGSGVWAAIDGAAIAILFCAGVWALWRGAILLVGAAVASLKPGSVRSRTGADAGNDRTPCRTGAP